MGEVDDASPPSFHSYVVNDANSPISENFMNMEDVKKLMDMEDEAPEVEEPKTPMGFNSLNTWSINIQVGINFGLQIEEKKGAILEALENDSLILERDLEEAMVKYKGEEKVMQGYAFSEDGLLSQEAIKLLDNGSLLHISKSFKKAVIDMDE
ncbi:hypothetical protein POM88_029642 [Heracleum sosnowskyi]|uniref:Uncharacterized protein n=1 Tax=Heracleum sosnowskyi TaxID=360622 RepID=A0AAD8HU19_9APIA|nr:hypothetical protein POM88_029642 [Heracleum sosnowskyi]